MDKKVEISYKTVLFSLGILLLLWLAYLLRDIIFLFYISILLVLALGPGVNALTRRGLPRILAALMNYLIFLVLLVLAVYFLAGPLVQQSGSLVQQLANLGGRLGIGNWLSGSLENSLANILSLSGNILRVTQTVFNNLLQVTSVFVISFYLLLGGNKLLDKLTSFLNNRQAKKIEKVIIESEKEVSHWLWGQLLLMLIVGVITYLILLILRVPYALPLAFLAGILEVFPNIGPIIAAIPATVIGFGVSPLKGFFVLVAYILIQQLENNLIVPKIMQGVTGINPVVALVGVLVGYRLGGVVGALFILPSILIGRVLFEEIILPQVKKIK
jgi:predicted PurR-regulated permease PerM